MSTTPYTLEEEAELHRIAGNPDEAFMRIVMLEADLTAAQQRIAELETLLHSPPTAQSAVLGLINEQTRTQALEARVAELKKERDELKAFTRTVQSERDAIAVECRAAMSRAQELEESEGRLTDFCIGMALASPEQIKQKLSLTGEERAKIATLTADNEAMRGALEEIREHILLMAGREGLLRLINDALSPNPGKPMEDKVKVLRDALKDPLAWDEGSVEGIPNLDEWMLKWHEKRKVLVLKCEDALNQTSP